MNTDSLVKAILGVSPILQDARICRFRFYRNDKICGADEKCHPTFNQKRNQIDLPPAVHNHGMIDRVEAFFDGEQECMMYWSLPRPILHNRNHELTLWNPIR